MQAECTDSFVAVNGVKIPHNSKRWELKTNRHTSTSGNSWGWIEGCPGHVCWSNDTGEWSAASAAEAIRLHNKWLVLQQPLTIRVADQRLLVEKVRAAYDEAAERFDNATERRDIETAELSRLLAMLDDGHATEAQSLLSAT